MAGRAYVIAPSPEKPDREAACSDEIRLTREARKELPRTLEARYKDLAKKRDAESLTPSEYDELLDLTDRIERFEVQRLEALSRLAKLRGLSLRALIGELGLQPSPNG